MKKKWDSRIGEEIQRDHHPLPERLERKVTAELEKITPLPRSERKRSFSTWWLAAPLATGALLIALLIIQPSPSASDSQTFQKVRLHSAAIHGHEALTVVFEEAEPELTVIWIDNTDRGTGT